MDMSNNFRRLRNRSDAYQSTLLEIAFSHELLDIFDANDSLYSRLNPFAYNDKIAQLEDDLKEELWRIIEENLTARQKEVVRLYASGKTQIEVAKILGVNQSSITKCIYGNVDYKNKDARGKPIAYGGIKMRLAPIVKKDERINKILIEIADIRENAFI